MTKKITQKRLRELAADTNLKLQRYFVPDRNRWDRPEVNSNSLDMETRIVNAGSDMETAVKLGVSLQGSIRGSLSNFLSGISADLHLLVDHFVSRMPEIQPTINSDRYVTITEDEIISISKTSAVIAKLKPNWQLFYGVPGRYGEKYPITQITLGQMTKPDHQETTIPHPKFAAVQLELSQLFLTALRPARNVLQTRIRRHGGTFRFGTVDHLQHSLVGSNMTEDEAKVLFDAIVDQVETSLNRFASLLVNKPELLSLAADLKSLHLQAHDFNEDVDEDYLELI